MYSRQYQTDAWYPMTLNRDGQSVSCNFNPNPDRDSPTLCIIPTQAKDVVENPASLKEKPNVMSQWLDRLTAAGANVLLVHGQWFDNLRALAKNVNLNNDEFARWITRATIVVDHAKTNGYGNPEKFVLMGSSRHGFAILHALASIPSIAAGVAHQPVVWWPSMEEFKGMDNNLVILSNDLYLLTRYFPPRPLLIQTGYDDQRVGQVWIERFIKKITDSYRSTGKLQEFTHEIMDIPGHDGTRIPDSALDSVVVWMQNQKLF